VKFEHINIISRDWRKLVTFYQEVFDCAPLYPERSLAGEELSRGTGVHDAQLKGVQLQLPGHPAEGPRLEIFQYSRIKAQLPPAANRLGLQHLAFRVDDVAAYQEKVIACGGQNLGEVVTLPIAQVGTIKFAYVTDPEDNIIELQQRE
jgi:catechol 2,3-dioxygenase-like lactoylglutathione lyase family enzyme